MFTQPPSLDAFAVYVLCVLGDFLLFDLIAHRQRLIAPEMWAADGLPGGFILWRRREWSVDPMAISRLYLKWLVMLPRWTWNDSTAVGLMIGFKVALVVAVAALAVAFHVPLPL